MDDPEGRPGDCEHHANAARKLDNITPGSERSFVFITGEWNKLQTRYQELMRQLEELPHVGKKASPDKDPGQNPKHEISSQKNLKQKYAAKYAATDATRIKHGSNTDSNQCLFRV